MTNKWIVGIAAFVLLPLPTDGVAGGPKSWTSKRGLFTVSYVSSIEPITINRIHEWILRIETVGGEPVTTAELKIVGGMPAHDHGLPTSPRVTENLGGGDYRVQGLRFHMAGEWLLEITIDDGERTDSVTVTLSL